MAKPLEDMTPDELIQVIEQERAYSRVLETAFETKVTEEAERRHNERVQADINRMVESRVFAREQEAYILREAGSKTNDLLDAILPRKSKKTLRTATKKDVELACFDCLSSRNPNQYLAYWFYLIFQEMPEDKTVGKVLSHLSLKWKWEDAERLISAGHRVVFE